MAAGAQVKNDDIISVFAFLLICTFFGLFAHAIKKTPRDGPRMVGDPKVAVYCAAVASMTDEQYRAFSRDFKVEDYR